jgi:peptidyl-Lys metalloendopeptidase
MNKTFKIAACAAALGLSFSAAAKVHTGLDVSVSFDSALMKNSQDIYANVTINNRSGADISMLKWYLPDADGQVEEHVFSLTHNGEQVDYLGRHVKRHAPTSNDYVTIAAGESITFSSELSSTYDVSKAGQYQVDFNASNYQLFSMDNGKPSIKGHGSQKAPVGFFQAQSSNSAFFTLDEDRPSAWNSVVTINGKGKRCNPKKEDCGGEEPPATGDVTFTGACSNTEQSKILTALDAAKSMANDSVSYLNGSAGQRYNSWFGAYSSNRWGAVASNFDSIKDALDNKPKTFDCGCNQSYFAYVYPTQPYKIYLCRAFWSAGTTGTDSKAGTIIHEMSHFNAVAGTDDIVYGQTGARNLAQSSPNQAINNADSHEYFAENTPSEN